MNAKTIIVTAGLLFCAGCASGDLERTGCALQAFGNGVRGQPDPACLNEIRAREAALPAPRRTPAQNELEAGTKGLVEQVDKKRLLIAVQKYVISQQKEEPSLTDGQLKWLVTIEDLLVEADDIYSRARIEFFLSDKNMNRDAEMRRVALFESVKTFSAAMTKHDKATRDLDTILTRIELQKKKGSINPVPTTRP